MELVEKPLPFAPHACLVTLRDDGEVVDFGVDHTGVDPHIYLKREIVEEAAELLGLVPSARVARLEQRCAELADALAELLPQIEALKTVNNLIGDTNGNA
jgi:hypothetical protein